MQLPRENRQLSGVAPPPSDVEGQLDKVKARLHQCFVIFLVFSPPFVFTFFFLADFLTHRGLVSGKRACAGKFQRFKSDQCQCQSILFNFCFSSVFKSDQCQLTQHSQSIFQSTLCFFSVFGESRILQRATSE